MAIEPTYSLRDLINYFLKLGSIGFGGPIALVGSMHQDLVEDRKWISEEDYKEGLALSQLAPGPLAAQLSIYIGFIHYRILGATLAGLAFVLPSFLMILVLGWAYVHFGGLPWMQAVFYGVGSAVIGIIAVSSYKLTVKSIGKNWILLPFFLLSAFLTFYYEEESILVIIYSGFIYMFIKAPPDIKMEPPFVFAPLGLILKGIPLNSKYAKMAWFFTKAGTFVFGSGLAIVPFLYGGVVKEYNWLNEQQFVDAVAVAMITPGPVIITVGFIGYLTGGFTGAVIAALATFIPCYLFTILPAPYFKKFGKNPSLKAFIDGVTIAAIGAIAGAVIIMAQKQLTDWVTISFAIITVILLVTVKKIKEPYIILAAALIAVLIKNI
jgi:chromate transporter